jgi:hypothetical protein
MLPIATFIMVESTTMNIANETAMSGAHCRSPDRAVFDSVMESSVAMFRSREDKNV